MTTDRLPLLSIFELAALPAPTYVLDGMLPEGAFITLYGPSAAGKSFLALDWSLCIAAGIPWYGREVQQGPVLFIAAEGVGGLYRRIDAWLTARDQDPPADIYFIAGAINFLDRTALDIAKATVAAMPKPPSVIVVDTMARSMPGGDENAARDVGTFIASLDDLARPYGAARLVVHHTGKNGDDERGSSALRGASDTMIALKPDNASLRLTCEKQKDAEPFERWTLHLQQIAESCVIECGTRSDAIGPAELEILERVSNAFGTQWAKGGEMERACGQTHVSHYRARKALIDAGSLEAEDDSRQPRYRITPLGLDRVPTSSNEFHGTGQVSSTVSASIGSGTGTRTETRNGNTASFDANPSELSQRIHEIAKLPEDEADAAWEALEVEMGLAA
jgi:hypothetical protein